MSDPTLAEQPSPEAIKEALGETVNDEDLAAIQEFIEKAGSIEAARAALDMLDELKDAA